MFRRGVLATRSTLTDYGFNHGGYTGSAVLAALYRYSISGNTWVTRTPTTQGQYYQGTSSIASSPHSIAGIYGGAVSSQNNSYSNATDTWTVKTATPVARYQHTQSTIVESAYVISGLDSASNYISSVYGFDDNSNSWAAKASLTNARYAVASSLGTNLLYHTCGYTPSGEISSHYEYSKSSNTWASKLSRPYTGHALTGGCVFNEYVYTVLGLISNGYTTAAYRYQRSTNIWIAITSSLGSRSSPRAFTVGRYIYACGGYYNVPTDTLYRYDHYLNSWTTLTSLPSVTYVGGACA